MSNFFQYPKEEEKEMDVCFCQDIVAYYEEGHGKYGDIVGADIEVQNKFETFVKHCPLYGIKDWNCIPFLDGKEIPYFFDHPEAFEVIDHNTIYNEDIGMIDLEESNTHTVVCLHYYKRKNKHINDLRSDIKEWANKYSDIENVSIVENGSWYNEDCTLIVIEQKREQPTIAVYDYYYADEIFSY